MKYRRILVLTSTFPQFENDPRGRFVSRYWAKKQLLEGVVVRVLAPRSSSSVEGTIDTLDVRRFAYAPKRFSNLTGRFGILENLREYKWRWLLVPAYFYRQWNALKREIRAFAPDLVVAHMFIPSGIAVARICRRKGIPFHLYGHGSDVDLLLKLPQYLGRKSLEKLALAERWYLPSQEKLERVRRYSQKVACGHPILSVEYMRSSLDFPSLDSENGEHATQKSRSSLSILYIGRLTKQKGVDVLLRAVAMLQSVPSVDIAGDGPERKRLVKLANKLGIDAKFHGFVDPNKRDKLYASTKVLCVPSRIWKGMGEGAPLVICEAQKFGMHIIASKIGGIPELCAGYAKSDLIPPDDVTVLQQILIELQRKMCRTTAIDVAAVGKKITKTSKGDDLLEVRAC